METLETKYSVNEMKDTVRHISSTDEAAEECQEWRTRGKGGHYYIQT